jgi:hypothetical protein
MPGRAGAPNKKKSQSKKAAAEISRQEEAKKFDARALGAIASDMFSSGRGSIKQGCGT